MSEFIINNGVLEKYTGNGGDVVIPEGMEEIAEEVFSHCDSLTIYASAGSCAAQYAEENRRNWV